MKENIVGLLPLYIELYDKSLPQFRPKMDEFNRAIAAELTKRGLRVLTTDLCRVKKEFEAAIRRFETDGADAIVTLHLAYSPSLESSAALAATRLPLIVLDTTPTHAFGPNQSPDEIMYNHGIHGVQDMCNLLLRNGKDFFIEAGHWEKSDVLGRVVTRARAAGMARAMRAARVGRIGDSFAGMGDFAIAPEHLKQAIGMEVVPAPPAMLAQLAASVQDAEIAKELAADHAAYLIEKTSDESLRRTARTSLAVRAWLAKEKLTAFSFNFLVIDKACGLPTVPFLEASKAMGRGIGYAGEGDVLTAGLVGAIASVLPEVSFTEMFCPDWAGERIFLSHMGEMNINLIAGKPLLKERPFKFTDALPPVAAIGCFKPGQAVFVNLAPVADDHFRLIIAPCRVAEPVPGDKFTDSIHGWITPNLPLGQFLEEYSLAGGTHHAALVYGDVTELMENFARIMGWDPIIVW